MPLRTVRFKFQESLILSQCNVKLFSTCRDDILSLRLESMEIKKVLQLAQSGTNQDNDEQDVETLISLMDKVDQCQRLCEDVGQEIKDLDKEVSVSLKNVYIVTIRISLILPFHIRIL